MAQTKVKLISDGVIDVGHLASGHGITTDNIGEGSNLYYTDARVSTYLSTNNYATEGYVTTAVANLVDSAPTTLDTLNELAAALGDDPNFATTVTNSIATKLPLAGGNITGNLGINASSPRSKLDINGIITQEYGNVYQIKQGATEKYYYSNGASYNAFGTGVLGIGTTGDAIQFATSNSVRATINSSGNIGIGVGNPTYKLDVVGFSRFNNGFYLQEATSGTNAAIYLDDSQRLRLQSFGTSGAVRFDVGSSLTEAVIIGSDAQTTFYNNIRFGPGDGVDWKIVGNANGPLIKLRRNSATTDRYGILGWRDNGSGEYDAIKWVDTTVTMPGSVGIGTTAPEAKLHVSIADSGADESRKEIQRWTHAGQNTMSVFAYGNTADTIQLGAFNGEQNISIVTDSYSNISKDNTKGIFIKSGGNVGIGQTNPSVKLEVNGYAAIGTYAAPHYSQSGMAYQIIKATSGSDAQRAMLEVHSGAGGTKGIFQSVGGNNTVYSGTITNSNYAIGNDVVTMYFNTAGNVGIGQTNPNAKLDVEGVIRYGDATYAKGALSYDTNKITLEASSANTSVSIIPSGTGNVGINTLTPQATLDVNGSHRFRGDNYSEYTWNASGNYTSGTYYNIVDNFQGLLSGIYVIHCYVDTYAVGGGIYFMHFASVPFYWVNTTTNNTSYQDLPQVLGTGHARNSVTPPSFRLQQTPGGSGANMYLQFNPNANWSNINGGSGQTFTVLLKRIGG